jgi:tetratricopeptide (TPR) repeat protein
VSTLTPLVLHFNQAQNVHDNELQAMKCLLEPSTELTLLTKGLVIILCHDDDDDEIHDGPQEDLEQHLASFSIHPHIKLQIVSLSWDDVYLWVREWCIGLGNCAEETIQETSDFVYESTLGNPLHIHYLLVYMEMEGFDIGLSSTPSIDNTENGANKDVYQLFQQVLELRSGHYTFVNPRFQRSAFALIAEDKRPQVHLRIGRRIWKNAMLGENYNDEGLLNMVAMQLQLGVDCANDSKERQMIANIHWEVGKRAMQWANFSEAAAHFEFSISVLRHEAWSRDLYSMSLGIHNYAAEAYYCAGDFDQMDRVLGSVFANACTFEDKLHAYTTLAFANGARHRLHEVLSTTLSVLNQLNVSIKPDPSKAAVFAELVRTHWRLRTKNNRFFRNLPMAIDSNMISAMTLLSLTMLYSYALKPECGAMALFHCIRLTLKHGVTAPSTTAFCSYGAFLANTLWKCTEGYRFGQLSLAMLDDVDSRAWLPRVYFTVYGLINVWVHPFRESVKPLLYAQRSALKSGDFEGGLTCASLYLMMASYSGQHLSKLQEEIKHFCSLVESLGQTTGLLFIVPMWSLLCDLTGTSPSDLNLNCNVNDGIGAMSVAKEEGNQLVLSHGYIGETIYRALTGRYAESVDAAIQAQKIIKDARFELDFYGGLSMLACARSSTGWSRHRLMAKGRRAVQRLRQRTKTCPANFGNKLALLEAEWEVLHGRTQRALFLFDKSIMLAKSEGFVQDEGLTYERLAQYNCFLGNYSLATVYYKCAREAYSQWGAQALADRQDKLLAEHNKTRPN